MKKFIIILLILIMGISLSFAGTYSGGDGSSGNPYKIATINTSITNTWNIGDHKAIPKNSTKP